MTEPARPNEAATWTGFLIVAFGVVGLIGAFSTYAAQIPFERAYARSHTLDRVLAATTPAALDELRPLLGERAEAVLQGPGTLAARVAAERHRMLEELHADSADYGLRLRVVIAAFTTAAALFGAMVTSVARK